MVFKRPLQHTVLQHTVLANPLPSPRTVLRPIRLRDTRRLARAHPKEHIFHWQWVTSDHLTPSAQQSPHFASLQDARSACDARPLSRLCFAGYETMRPTQPCITTLVFLVPAGWRRNRYRTNAAPAMLGAAAIRVGPKPRPWRNWSCPADLKTKQTVMTKVHGHTSSLPPTGIERIRTHGKTLLPDQLAQGGRSGDFGPAPDQRPRRPRRATLGPG